jgi:hypothetical protein
VLPQLDATALISIALGGVKAYSGWSATKAVQRKVKETQEAFEQRLRGFTPDELAGLLERAGTLPEDSLSATLGSPGALLPTPPQSSSRSSSLQQPDPVEAPS